MKKIVGTKWSLLPMTIAAIAAVVLSVLLRPSTQAAAFRGLTPEQAHELKAQMHTGQVDADLIKRPNANLEGSPSSADAQFTAERTYPASDVPAAGYSNGFNEYSLMSQPGGGTFGWKELGPTTTSNGSVWGPAAAGSISGRATAIAVDPSSCSAGSCSTIYLGTAGGGLWKSTTGGHNWTSLMERQSSLSVGSIAIDPKNSSTVYVGLGEPNNSVDSSRGQGILKSTDGGRTWTTLGFNTFVNRSVADIVVDPTNGSLYAVSYQARSGGAGTTYGSSLQNPYLPALGFYRSTDGGQTWTLSNPTATLAKDGTGRQGATSLVRASNGTLYLGIYNQGIYKSTDGGQTWTALTNSSESSGSFDRITLAVAPSDPNVVYAAYSHDIDGNGGETLYRSANGGSAWVAQTNTPSACTGQCWYDMPVAVSPTNANEVYLGGMFNYGGCTNNADGTFPAACNTVIEKSLDGGAHWYDIGDPTTGVNVHPDDHAILPTANGGLYTGNDGGLYHSSNDGTSWESLNNGIGSLQFQGVSVNSNGDVFGGTQDNGTWMLRNSSTVGNHIMGGDGGMTMADPSNSNIAFDEYYGSQLSRFNASTGSQTWMAGWWGDYFMFGGGLFYEPMAMGTKTASGTSASDDVFSGSYRLWRSTTGGGTDTNNDGDATNDSSDKTDFVPITPNVGNISAVSVNPSNPNDVAFATSTGAIYYTTNALAPVQLNNACNPSTPLPSSDPTSGIVNAYCAFGSAKGYLSTTASGSAVCSQPWTNAWDTSSFCDYAGGVTWTRLDLNGSSAKQLPNRWISSLTFDSTGKLYASFSGFDENTPGFAGHVFVTNGAASTSGNTWTNITGSGASGLPDLPANKVLVAANGHLLVAADIGVFVSKDNGQTWQREDYTLANAPVYDLALSPDGKTVYAATHGRGIWRASVP